MADFQDIATRYIATFNETDAERRRAQIEQLHTADGTYIDPQVEVAGPEQIDAFIAATQEHFPGYVFELHGPLDAHHWQARFQWRATAPGESDPAYVGFDVLVTEDGRVRRVYGFLDATPAA